MRLPTPEQCSVIASQAQRIFVNACPGAGKTTALAARIKADIERGDDPASLVVITYTNAAAAHIAAKLDGVHLGFIGTLHGWAIHLLAAHGRSCGWRETVHVIDQETANELLEKEAIKMGVKRINIAELHRWKASREITPPAALAAQKYKKRLRENSAVDFDTALTECHSILERRAVPAFRRLYVDEAQDSAGIDFEIFKAAPCDELFIVADPDQGIFGFRGARALNLVEFAADPETTVYTLTGNFRSGSVICDAAQRLIENNPHRLAKRLASQTGTIGSITATGFASPNHERAAVVAQLRAWLAAGTPPSEIAVIARTNAVVTEYRHALAAAGLSSEPEPDRPRLPEGWPLLVSAVSAIIDDENDFAARRWLDECAPSARADGNGTRAQNAMRALGIGPEGNVWQKLAMMDVGKACVSHLYECWTGSLQGTLAAILSAEREQPEDVSEGVTVCTIHGAKGKEWDFVALPAFEAGQGLPGNANGEDLEEARRLAYVAITRARRAVAITHSAWRNNPFTRSCDSAEPSPFILEAITP